MWGGLPTPVELRDFLWLLSPHHNQKGGWRKLHHKWKCRRFMPAKYLAIVNTKWARAWHKVKCNHRNLEAARTIVGANKYIASTFMDRPPSRAQGFDPDYYSDGAFFTMLFGRECGWPPAVILKMPMRCIFQQLKEMNNYHGSKIPLCNPSDSVKAKWARDLSKHPRG
jgi:hypothetical protein